MRRGSQNKWATEDGGGGKEGRCQGTYLGEAEGPAVGCCVGGMKPAIPVGAVVNARKGQTTLVRGGGGGGEGKVGMKGIVVVEEEEAEDERERARARARRRKVLIKGIKRKERSDRNDGRDVPQYLNWPPDPVWTQIVPGNAPFCPLMQYPVSLHVPTPSQRTVPQQPEAAVLLSIVL